MIYRDIAPYQLVNLTVPRLQMKSEFCVLNRMEILVSASDVTGRFHWRVLRTESIHRLFRCHKMHSRAPVAFRLVMPPV